MRQSESSALKVMDERSFPDVNNIEFSDWLETSMFNEVDYLFDVIPGSATALTITAQCQRPGDPNKLPYSYFPEGTSSFAVFSKTVTIPLTGPMAGRFLIRLPAFGVNQRLGVAVTTGTTEECKVTIHAVRRTV